MPRKPTWTCQRTTGGVRCRAENANRYRNCQTCGKPRRPRERAAHEAALDQPYAVFVAANGGEWCGICGTEPSTKNLDRDHCHRTGIIRGVLCHGCNRALGRRLESAAGALGVAEWLRRAAEYVERAEQRAANEGGSR